MNETTNDLRVQLDEIAGHLDGWHVEAPHDHNAQLVNGDGVTIWAHVETYGAKRGRIRLSAGVPTEANYSSGDYSGLDSPEITVSPDRPAATLARDIERRLLGDAVDYWNTVQGRIARRLSALNSRETLANELSGLMGGKARFWRDEWAAELPDSLRQESAYTYGDMKPSYDAQTVTVEIRNLSADRARQLAALIATWGE